MRNISKIYWLLMGISILTLLLNVGLFFLVGGIILLPLLILHILVGRKIKKLKEYKWLVILSFLNLFLFALVRPDGVHGTTGIGLSALLDLLGLNGGFNRDYENYYYVATFIVFIIQVIIDSTLLILSRKAITEN